MGTGVRGDDGGVCLHLPRPRAWRVVGRPRPAAGVARDLEIADRLFERARYPDVIEPSAAIADRPVGGAVTPPSVDLLRQRDAFARNVDPFAMRLRREQFFTFDRGVRDDFQQLLLLPDAVFV